MSTPSLRLRGIALCFAFVYNNRRTASTSITERRIRIMFLFFWIIATTSLTLQLHQERIRMVRSNGMFRRGRRRDSLAALSLSSRS